MKATPTINAHFPSQNSWDIEISSEVLLVAALQFSGD